MRQSNNNDSLSLASHLETTSGNYTGSDLECHYSCTLQVEADNWCVSLRPGRTGQQTLTKENKLNSASSFMQIKNK